MCMWPDLPKDDLFAHDFNADFLPPSPNEYNNRLTVHAYAITKTLTVYF